MPYPVAIINGIVYTLTFLFFGFVARLPDGMDWLPALLVAILVYEGMFVAFALFDWFVIRRVFHVTALPM